jgi:hypothetical protein
MKYKYHIGSEIDLKGFEYPVYLREEITFEAHMGPIFMSVQKLALLNAILIVGTHICFHMRRKNLLLSM